MIRLLLPLAIAPTLAGCGLEELFNPGHSQARHEYRASITTQPQVQKPLQSTESPVQPASPPEQTTVAEIEPIAVPEPVYVLPSPPPSCQPVYAIYRCSDTGDVIWL